MVAKKKIGVISDAPNLTTGFGITCRNIVIGLAESGYEVVCFGIGLIGDTLDRSLYPCRIWAAGQDNLVTKLAHFIKYENLDVVFLNFDIGTVQVWSNLCRSVGWSGPIVAYFVLDGLPLSIQSLSGLKQLSAKITATESGKAFLKKHGVDDIIVAPHGVDMQLFRPLRNRKKLKEVAGLGSKFVVGVFGRNNDRKQQPRILLAMQHLKAQGRLKDILVYFHCQPVDDPRLGGWDLPSLAQALEIDDFVFFPHEEFNQLAGVPVQNKKSHQIHSDIRQTSNQGPAFPSTYSYIERINCCDVIVNVPFCGGFELVLIEAQACGVPIVSTDDSSIMAEVVGDGGYLIPPIDVGIWRTGAKQYFVSPVDIAKAIISVKNNADLRHRLVQEGLRNAKKYQWKSLQRAAVAAVRKATITN
jgi:glycosyltransferase involved in cell wall biosynthesis